MNIEVWKSVSGHEGRYEVSNFGRVRAVRTGIILKTPAGGRGYATVTLYRGDKNSRKSHHVHRLIALHFLPAIEGKSCVNHIDGCRVNNKINNLEWCTPLENSQHAAQAGRLPTGLKNGNAKLSDDQVREVKSLLKSGLRPPRIAREFSVSPDLIRRIKHGQQRVNVL